LEVFFVGLLGREYHVETGLELVAAEFLLQTLQVERVLNELVVDFN